MHAGCRSSEVPISQSKQKTEGTNIAFCLSYTRRGDCADLKVLMEERQAPSPIVYSADQNHVLVGELYGAKPENVFMSEWETKPSVLNDFCSAMCVISFDQDGCSFASDLSGYEPLWYYHTDKMFVLADTFWDVVKVLQPGLEDVDKETLNMMFVAEGASTEL